jgi:hypothetical protein
MEAAGFAASDMGDSLKGCWGDSISMEEEEVDSRQLKVERKKEGLRVVNCSAKGCGSPHTPVFWPKSAELIENKEVEFWMGAKKCKKMQKSSEEHETKGGTPPYFL